MNQIRQVPSQGSAFSERWFEAQRAHPNIGRDRKDQDSEPEQGLHLLPAAWDCLGPRAPTLGRHRGQPACGSALWRVWHTPQAACGRESQWAQGTFQETQLGISECSVHSKSWLTLIPRNRFSQAAAPLSRTRSCKTALIARAAWTLLSPRAPGRVPLP